MVNSARTDWFPQKTQVSTNEIGSLHSCNGTGDGGPPNAVQKYESAFRTIASNPSQVPQWLTSQLQFDSLLKFSDPCSLRKGLSLSSKRAVATSDTSFEGMPSCNTNAPAHLDGRPLPLGLKVSHDAQASCIHPQLGGPPAMHVLLVRILLLDSPPRLNGKIFKGSN